MHRGTKQNPSFSRISHASFGLNFILFIQINNYIGTYLHYVLRRLEIETGTYYLYLLFTVSYHKPRKTPFIYYLNIKVERRCAVKKNTTLFSNFSNSRRKSSTAIKICHGIIQHSWESYKNSYPSMPQSQKKNLILRKLGVLFWLQCTYSNYHKE